MLSLFVYLTCLFSPLFFYLIINPKSEKQRKFVYFTAYFPTFIFAAFRSISTGTDTENYSLMFDAIDADSFFTGFQFDLLFSGLIVLVKSIYNNFTLFCFTQALITYVFYCLGAAKIDKKLPILGVGILPVLLINSTFNGMRFGIAFSILCYIFSIINITKLNGSLKTFLALLIPIQIHYSLYALLALHKYGIYILGVILTLIVFGYIDWNNFMLISGKVDSYSDFQKPNILSGLMPIIQFVMINIVYYRSKGEGSMFKELKYKTLISINLLKLSIFIFVFGYIVSIFSYAGLRFMEMGVFFLAIGASKSIETSHKKEGFLLILFLSLLSILNFLRQIFFIGPLGGVCYIPYDFF